MAVNNKDRHHDRHEPRGSREESHRATAKSRMSGEGDEAPRDHCHSEQEQTDTSHNGTPSSNSDAIDSRVPSPEDVAHLEASILDLQNRLKRALADQENSRKRTQRDAETAVKFAVSSLAADLLPTLDNLQFALNAVPNGEVANESMKRLLQGIRATECVLLSTMKKHGINRIDPLREPFDPNRHQVVAEVDRSDLPEGTVADVLQPGYLYHDRLLRPAMVNVAKGSPKGAPEET